MTHQHPEAIEYAAAAPELERVARGSHPAPALLRCPFCGQEAGFEEVDARASNGVVFSVGCETRDERAGTQCFGYMSAAKFSTKRDAADAWNTRDARPRP